MILIVSTFRVDTSKDKFLDEDELTEWISKKVKDHFTMALKENIFLFTSIDLNPKNGKSDSFLCIIVISVYISLRCHIMGRIS